MAADKAAGECGGNCRGPLCPPCPPRASAAWCGGIRSGAGGDECRYVPDGRSDRFLTCSALFPSAEEVSAPAAAALGPPAAGVRCRWGLCPGGSPEAGPSVSLDWKGSVG